MPAYNFKAQFSPAVEAGQKLCTIRGRAAKVGTTAYLYTGMRTKACRKLAQGTIVDCININLGYEKDGTPRLNLEMTYKNLCNSKEINLLNFTQLAKADGFSSSLEMVNFFRDTYKISKPTIDGGIFVFSGYMITWELDK